MHPVGSICPVGARLVPTNPVQARFPDDFEETNPKLAQLVLIARLPGGFAATRFSFARLPDYVPGSFQRYEEGFGIRKSHL